MLLDLLTCEVRLLGVEDLAAAFQHLHLALSAAGLTATGRRKVDAVLVERGHQAVALCHLEGLVVVDDDLYVAARTQVFLGHEQDSHE